MRSNEYLKSLLEPQATTGKEKEKKITPDISVFVDPFGSYRFVKFLDNQPISAVQVMSKEQGVGHIANAYTHPDYRRQGHARDLLQEISKIFKKLTVSDDLSDEGREWVKSVF